jgi:hypothetical protein
MVNQVIALLELKVVAVAWQEARRATAFLSANFGAVPAVDLAGRMVGNGVRRLSFSGRLPLWSISTTASDLIAG